MNMLNRLLATLIFLLLSKVMIGTVPLYNVNYSYLEKNEFKSKFEKEIEGFLKGYVDTIKISNFESKITGLRYYIIEQGKVNELNVFKYLDSIVCFSYIESNKEVQIINKDLFKTFKEKHKRKFGIANIKYGSPFSSFVVSNILLYPSGGKLLNCNSIVYSMLFSSKTKNTRLGFRKKQQLKKMLHSMNPEVRATAFQGIIYSIILNKLRIRKKELDVIKLLIDSKLELNMDYEYYSNDLTYKQLYFLMNSIEFNKLPINVIDIGLL